MTLRIRIAHWLRRVAERLDPTPIDMWPVVPDQWTPYEVKTFGNDRPPIVTNQ